VKTSGVFGGVYRLVPPELSIAREGQKLDDFVGNTLLSEDNKETLKTIIVDLRGERVLERIFSERQWELVEEHNLWGLVFHLVRKDEAAFRKDSRTSEHFYANL
jgi:hypothetical protein